MSIHIIDDEVHITEFLSEILSQYSSHILSFQSAEQYLLHMESDTFLAPDLILTDVRMGGMDGFSLIKKVRTTGSTASIIVMSGFSGHHVTEKLYDARLDKPFNIDFLLKTVSRLHQQASRRESQ